MLHSPGKRGQSLECCRKLQSCQVKQEKPPLQQGLIAFARAVPAGTRHLCRIFDRERDDPFCGIRTLNISICSHAKGQFTTSRTAEAGPLLSNFTSPSGPSHISTRSVHSDDPRPLSRTVDAGGVDIQRECCVARATGGIGRESELPTTVGCASWRPATISHTEIHTK